MSLPRPMIRSALLAASRPSRKHTRPISQWIDKCPEPCCVCAATPPDLDIDRDSAMTFGPYREHIAVCTGRDDWASKIEMDTSTGPVTRHLKALFGPPAKRARAQRATPEVVPGKYHNPYSPHMITNVSFASPHAEQRNMQATEAEIPFGATSFYLFPSFEFVTMPAATTFEDYSSTLDHLARRVVNNTMATNPSHEEREHFLQNCESKGTASPPASDALRIQQVKEVVILICGHGGRDSRCGALGPPLKAELERKLKDVNISTIPRLRPRKVDSCRQAAHVGLISHIGGHKWAGNVIIYIPPTWQSTKERPQHDLAGTAIWYGRVEPKHVEGIVQETVLGGRLIKDLWRGGMRLSSQGEDSASWESIAYSTS